jgi:HEAT repeats
LERLAQSDSFALVREAAMTALARHPNPRGRSAIAHVAEHDPEPRVRAAALALLEHGPK